MTASRADWTLAALRFPAALEAEAGAALLTTLLLALRACVVDDTTLPVVLMGPVFLGEAGLVLTGPEASVFLIAGLGSTAGFGCDAALDGSPRLATALGRATRVALTCLCVAAVGL